MKELVYILMYIIEKFEHQIFISFSTVYVDKQGKQNCKWIDPSLSADCCVFAAVCLLYPRSKSLWLSSILFGSCVVGWMLTIKPSNHQTKSSPVVSVSSSHTDSLVAVCTSPHSLASSSS
jgi:hypothetical protein